MTPDQAREIALATWQGRAIKATRGATSKLGCILLSCLGKHSPAPPWFGPSAVIDTAGNVLANFVDRHNVLHEAVFVASVRDLVENFSRLADTINATDDEREEMFAKVRGWIAKDFRAMAESTRTLH